MNGSSVVLFAIVIATLVGTIIGLITGILTWIQKSSLPVTERTASAILRGGAAFAAAILLVLAVFTAAGTLR
jgi:uncharacterized membrane protein